MIIAICDDDKVFVEKIRRYLSAKPFINKILTYSNYDVLLADIKSYMSPDAVLMDMDWNKTDDGEGGNFSKRTNGMVLAETMMKYSPKTKILYITSYVDHFASRIFLHEANVIGFLSKPIETELLDVYLNRIQDSLEQEEMLYLEVTRQRTKINIRIKDILYIESNNHVIRIVMDQTEQEFAQSLHSIESSLPLSFVQCHKSYIVNLERVEHVTREGITLTNSNKMVPVGRKYYEDVRKKYMLYLAKNI